MKRGRFEEFLEFIRCHDFRVTGFPVSDTTLEDYVARLRSGYGRKHLRFLKPLGIRHVFAWVGRGTSLYKKILKTRSYRELEVPAKRLLYGVACGASGCLVAWYEPPGLGVYRVVSGELREAETVAGYMLPVHRCGSTELELGAHAERLLATPLVSLKTPAIAYILVAALDYDPLLTPGRLRDAFYAAAARGMDVAGYELKTRFYRRYYARLSHSYVLGRAYVYKSLPGTWFLVVAERWCLPTVYAVAALYKTGAHVAVNKDYVAATMVTGSAEPLHRILETCRAAARVEALLNAYTVKFPYEHYDPVEKKWGWEPNNLFFEMLEKLRVVVARTPTTR